MRTRRWALALVTAAVPGCALCARPRRGGGAPPNPKGGRTSSVASRAPRLATRRTARSAETTRVREARNLVDDTNGATTTAEAYDAAPPREEQGADDKINAADARINETVAAADRIAAKKDRKALTLDDVRRRLWTPLDVGHTHAISGAAFLVSGVAWLALASEAQLSGRSAVLAGEPIIWGASASLAILAVGVWNGVSALPMTTDDRIYVKKDMDRYHALAFRWGGTAQLVACAWLCWWFSGLYPSAAVPAALDAALCAAAIASISWVIYFSEESIASLNRKVREGGWVHGRRAQDLDRAEVTQLAALARLGSYPNLFQLPVLANVLVGGRPWFDAVLQAYPAQGALLHHYLFACAISYAITFFATTLRDRNLISITQDLTMLAVGTAMPFLTMFVDTASYPTATTLNPLDYNVGFI